MPPRCPRPRNTVPPPPPPPPRPNVRLPVVRVLSTTENDDSSSAAWILNRLDVPAPYACWSVPSTVSPVQSSRSLPYPGEKKLTTVVPVIRRTSTLPVLRLSSPVGHPTQLVALGERCIRHAIQHVIRRRCRAPGILRGQSRHQISNRTHFVCFFLLLFGSARVVLLLSSWWDEVF